MLMLDSCILMPLTFSMSQSENTPSFRDSVLAKFPAVDAEIRRDKQLQEEAEHQRKIEGERAREHNEHALAVGMEVVRLLQEYGVPSLPLIEPVGEKVASKSLYRPSRNKYVYTGEAWPLYEIPYFHDPEYGHKYTPIGIIDTGQLCTSYAVSTPRNGYPEVFKDLKGSDLVDRECLILNSRHLRGVKEEGEIELIGTDKFQKAIARLILSTQ